MTTHTPLLKSHGRASPVEQAPAVDPSRALRSTLGHYATGVAVVTYATEDGPRGATISSFTSISMDPPLVQVSFARTAKAASWLGESPFTVNVLSSGQLDVAMQFAGRPQSGLEIPWVLDGAVPRLRGAVAWLECEPWSTYDGGDHLLFLGKVTAHEDAGGDPLLFHRGRFRMVGMDVTSEPRRLVVPTSPEALRGPPAHRIHTICEPAARIHD